MKTSFSFLPRGSPSSFISMLNRRIFAYRSFGTFSNWLDFVPLYYFEII